MKVTAIPATRYRAYRRSAAAPFPGASTRRFLDRLLSAALAAAITVAFGVIVLFLAALS